MAALAIRIVVNHLRARGMACQIGEALDDGSTIVCFAHVRVAKVSSGRPVLSAVKNILQGVKEAVLGQEERLFVAVHAKNGDVLLMLLYPNSDTATNELNPSDVDGEFHQGRAFDVPKLAECAIHEKEEGLFRVSLEGKRLLEGAHFDMKVESHHAIQWLKQQAARAK